MFTITLLSMAMALCLSIVVWRMVRDDRRRTEARVHALTDLAVRPDLHAASAAQPVTFTPPARSSPWGTRAAIIACLALALTALILMMLSARTRTSVSVASSTASAETTPASLPLELLSLRGTREAGTLTIAGLIKNPRGAGVIRNVKVSADVFDEKGTRIATGAGAVDVKALKPGEESPFVLSITTAEAVARYRVSFRSSDGDVIQHVDRRGRATEAASW